MNRDREVTLLDILDGLLEKGVVVAGGLVISIAEIDLIYVDLRLLITSIETISNGGSRSDEPFSRANSI